MSKELMVKDLISYHIQVEQEALKKQQELVHGLVNFLVKETGCPIELDVIDVPFDRQPKNRADDIKLFEEGKLIAGHNFEAYDIRRLRNVTVNDIRPAPYRCEITDLDLWVVRFDHDNFINVYGDLAVVFRLFGFINIRGELSEITDDTLNTGKLFINIDNEKRKLVHFGRPQILEWIVTESSLLKLWQKNGQLSKDVSYFYEGNLWDRNVRERHHQFERNKVLSVRRRNGEKAALSFSLRNLDDPQSRGTLEQQIFIAEAAGSDFQI